MKKIKLTQNQYTFIDDEDFDNLNQYKWFAHYCKSVENYYAERHNNRKEKRPLILMHRIILNAPSNMEVDHINHNTLDNRKENLRICTKSQNHMNQKHRKNAISRYKGVNLAKKEYKNKVYQYWAAHIRINGKLVFLGHFKSEIQAAKAYDKAAKELFGEFALLNEV